MHRFLVSAAHKSSGKTTVSIGLAAEMSRRGLGVQTFKKGPDYIDPMWLAAATGRSCRNLDFNLSTPEELQLEFARHGGSADVCLVEGNKGLYDGLDLRGRNSNAALAQLLGLPVVLVLDARGMTRGIAPLILGYQAFDSSIRIAGVILSRLGGARHEAKLRAVIEHYTDVPVLGAVHEDPRLAIVERHLGLIPAGEDAAAQSRIALLAAAVARQVDLARLLEATVSAAPLPAGPSLAWPMRAAAVVRIGIARDRAFGFYYPDDLEALERAGAELVFFDTLRDARLPRMDALIIGGGFPEICMHELEANAALRGDILAAIEAGMPAYAECGGLMYLARSLSWRGETRRMVGAIAGDVVMHERPVGRGYVRLAPTDAHPWPPNGADGGETPAHEFHYSSIEGLATDTRFAYRVARGFGTDGRSDGIVINNLLATYAHFRCAGSHDWAARFVAFVRSRLGRRALAAVA
ncbi:MAG: cobyrinate a,c-diamide synthase [Betaproteobacteria bacterium]|nr:MAG: cobyrinate a,c-diamide synthase [Betaproteobacteria bacterium]